jgi:hypothetical protein
MIKRLKLRRDRSALLTPEQIGQIGAQKEDSKPKRIGESEAG